MTWTFQVESFPAFLEEVKPLLTKHWEEIALDKGHVPLDPQYEVYLARDRAGEVMAVTARKDGALVGYFVGFVAPGLHYRTCLTCIGDIFYILPEHRGDGAGIYLFKAVEAECKRRGVQRMFAGSKLHKDVAFLFDKLGYAEVERTYCCTFFGGA